MPLVGAGRIAVAQHRPFQIAEPVETKQGLITGAAEVTVGQGFFLVSMGFAHRAIHVGNNLQDRFFPMDPVDPLSR